uniref:Transmembrane protein 202 n=1 Tax=Aotus nancymaae TaxID=37293 RepID=A0A2K5C916_AOTNA
MERREHLTVTFHSPEVPKIKGDRKYQRIISNIPGPSSSSLSSPYSLALAGSSALASLVEEA